MRKSHLQKFISILLLGNVYLTGNEFESILFYIPLVCLATISCAVFYSPHRLDVTIKKRNLPIFMLGLGFLWLITTSLISGELSNPLRALLPGFAALSTLTLFFFTKNNFEFARDTIFWGVVSGLLWTFYLVITGEAFEDFNASSSSFVNEELGFGNRNAVGNRLLATAVFVFLAYYTGMLKVGIAFAALCLLFLLTTLTFSLKSFVGLLMVYASFSLNVLGIGLTLVFLLAIVCVGFFINFSDFYALQYQIDRFAVIFGFNPFFLSSDDGRSFLIDSQGRGDLVSEGLKIFYNNPFFGIGLENSRDLIGAYTHTDFVELLASGGLIAPLPFYFAYGLIAKRIFCLKRSVNVKLSLLIVSIAILISGSAIGIYKSPAHLIPLFMIYICTYFPSTFRLGSPKSQ